MQVPSIAGSFIDQAVELLGNRLCGEKLMSQVNRHAIIPIVWLDTRHAVPLTVRGIVDQDCDLLKARQHPP